MTSTLTTTERILAIDPTTRGFAFAILEGPESLVDWGVTHVPTKRPSACLRRIAEFIDRYEPDVVVLEDYAGKVSRRCRRVQALIRSIAARARERHTRCRQFSRAEIRKAFQELGAVTKHDIAAKIADRFPELQPRLPRVRKCWMAEDERMNIFDAASLAVTYIYQRERRAKAPAQAA